jgi:hypothetical protein
MIGNYPFGDLLFGHAVEAVVLLALLGRSVVLNRIAAR